MKFELAFAPRSEGSGPVTESEIRLWKHSFRLLATAELGQVPTWDGPADGHHLRSRVELLALLLDVVPRSELGRLKQIGEEWVRTFHNVDEAEVDDLRQSARATLDRRTSFARTQAENDESYRQLCSMFSLDDAPPGSFHDFADQVRRDCVLVLRRWIEVARRSDQWRLLPSAVPGEAPVPIQEVYVDLTACLKGIDDRPRQSSRSQRDRSESQIGIASLISQTFRTCIVLGEPGGGKSTLFQWAVWATYHGQLRDFDVAIPIRLKLYCDALQHSPNLSLMEYFVIQDDHPYKNIQSICECLRQTSSKSGRFLLLLDGWDEVPIELKETVKLAIQREKSHFVTVLTSRFSGSPWEIFEAGTADCYEIAGLSPESSQRLVSRLLTSAQRSDQVASVVARIESTSELRSLSANPFLLGMLVKVLSEPSDISQELTRAAIYQRVAQWMVEQQRANSRRGKVITSEHLRGLERLAFHLVFELPSPQYVFDERLLEKWQPGSDSEPVRTSRFIHLLDRRTSGWSFLHATFEEFLAATFAAELPEVEFRQIWNSLLQSRNRTAVMSFLAGLCHQRIDIVNDLAARHLDRPDRFRMIWLQLAHAASHGDWGRTTPTVVQRITQCLWEMIIDPEDWVTSSLFLEAFAELDCNELVDQATTLDGKDARIWEAICHLVPPAIVRSSSLFRRLPPALKDAVSQRSYTPGALQRADMDLLLSQLNDRNQSVPAFLDVVDRACHFAESEIADALLSILQNVDDPSLETRIVMAVAEIYSAVPAEKSLEILTADFSWPQILRRVAATSLSHGSPNDGKSLDPLGRDQILRRLAALAPDDPNVHEELFLALRGYPIRDGGSLLAEIGTNPNVSVSTRSMICKVMHTVTDQLAVARVVQNVTRETSLDLCANLLGLAVARKIPLLREWMEQEISKDTHTWHRGSLTAAYIHTADGCEPEERDAYVRFLVGRIEIALSEIRNEEDDVCYELAAAWNRLTSGSWLTLHEEVLVPAAKLLEKFASQPREVTPGQVRLCVAILRFGSRPHHIELLFATLKTLIRHMGKVGIRKESLQLEAMATDTAQVLADLAPSMLLSFSEDCAPVRAVLSERCRERGWLIYDNQMLDGDGLQIADSEVPDETTEQFQPEFVLQLVGELPAARKNALMSRWLVIQAFRLVTADASVKSIHACIQAAADGS